MLSKERPHPPYNIIFTEKYRHVKYRPLLRRLGLLLRAYAGEAAPPGVLVPQRSRYGLLSLLSQPGGRHCQTLQAGGEEVTLLLRLTRRPALINCKHRHFCM